MMPLRPPSPLFPYTTLFRSFGDREHVADGTRRGRQEEQESSIPRPDRGAGSCHGTSLRPCPDRKSTRLNSSHQIISYAVLCLKKKTTSVARRSRRLPPSDAT